MSSRFIARIAGIIAASRQVRISVSEAIATVNGSAKESEQHACESLRNADGDWNPKRNAKQPKPLLKAPVDRLANIATGYL